ncbi:MAG: iron-sulfur cluster assembly scaffold protein [Candidatus Sungbacteria bacterium]|nr:iron-sulfur cluster assembly scaffold protein [bacterium]MDZ4285837.1 iron-sulfur cluster assembly scaffold protein [Candidatus Sungbacteria bacterium]
MNLYRQEIIDRARFPTHKAEIKKSDLQGEVMNVLCGDELTLFFMFDEKKENVADVSFSGQGCALMTASSDILCEHLIGKTIAQLKKFTADDMMALYGEMPSPSRLKCVLLPYEALKRAVAGIREQE